MVESEEDVKKDTCDGVSEVRKCFRGVTKVGNRWRARIQDPKLKFDVSLGCYGTHEEAVLVVKKKKAEFEEMFKGENNMNEETCRDDFEGRKRPYGVTKRGYDNIPEEDALILKKKKVEVEEMFKSENNMVEFQEKFNGKEDLKLDSNGVFEVRKPFHGVNKTGNKWRARIRHPKLKRRVYLGTYSSPEEAALAVKKKKAEFEEMLKGEIGMNVETCRDEFEGIKLPPGVSRRGRGRWAAQIWHPKLKRYVRLGSYGSPEEAAFIVDKKSAELLKIYGWSPIVKPNCNESKDNDIFFEKPKCFVGVSKKGNSWQARIQHPKLKFEIYLGCYNTPEEAAFAIQMKKTEFEETFEGENSVSVETFREEFEGRKLPCGVYRRGYQRWGARIWNPNLKHDVSLGSYSTPEEAAIAVKNKRAESLKIYDRSSEPGCKDTDISDEAAGDLKVPKGVRKLKSGKFGARITDPTTSTRIWLGSFDTAEDAVRSLNKSKAELAAKRKTVEFNGLEAMPKAGPIFEANEGPMKIECADNLNTVADDKSNYGEVNVPDKVKCKFVQCSPTSVFEPENSDSADAGDKSVIGKVNEQKTVSVFNFEEAMSMGFINEYGQLMGEYSGLDEQMEFRLPDDNDEAVADIGYY